MNVSQLPLALERPCSLINESGASLVAEAIQEMFELCGHIRGGGAQYPGSSHRYDPETVSHRGVGPHLPMNPGGGPAWGLDHIAYRYTQQTLGAVPGDCSTYLAAGHDGPGEIITWKQIKHKEASNSFDAFLVHS